MAITVKTYKYQGETYDCEYKIRQIFYSKFNTALPRNLTAEQWAAIGVEYSETQLPETQPTEQQIEQNRIATLKADNHNKIDSLTVVVDEMEFQANADSLSNITNAIQAMQITEQPTIQWVLKDNTVADVTLEQLQSVLTKAVAQITELRIQPYI